MLTIHMCWFISNPVSSPTKVKASQVSQQPTVTCSPVKLLLYFSFPWTRSSTELKYSWSVARSTLNSEAEIQYINLLKFSYWETIIHKNLIYEQWIIYHQLLRPRWTDFLPDYILSNIIILQSCDIQFSLSVVIDAAITLSTVHLTIFLHNYRQRKYGINRTPVKWNRKEAKYVQQYSRCIYDINWSQIFQNEKTNGLRFLPAQWTQQQ